jgi:adenine-specific DNA-methyltransferase
MAAGGIGKRERPQEELEYLIPKGSTYSVLFSESRFRQFKEELEHRPDVTHLWLVTDSEEAFADMRSTLPSHLQVSMLYRDYLRNFRINTGRNP